MLLATGEGLHERGKEEEGAGDRRKDCRVCRETEDPHQDEVMKYVRSASLFTVSYSSIFLLPSAHGGMNQYR